MIHSHWRVFTDTKRPDGAERLVGRAKALLDKELHGTKIEAYHKGGHSVTFELCHETDDWANAVYEAILCAQRIGYDWSISGRIDDELDLISTQTSVPGVKMVHCSCTRPGMEYAEQDRR